MLISILEQCQNTWNIPLFIFYYFPISICLCSVHFLAKLILKLFLYLDITKDKITNVSLKGDCFFIQIKAESFNLQEEDASESQNNHASDFWFIKLYSICS